MGWLNSLGKHLGVHLDSHTLGNLLKNVSPAAALIPGVGPLAAAGLAAGASALGDVARGKSPSLSNALTNGALGYGASGLLNSLGGGGASAASGASGTAAGSVAPTAGATAPSTVSIGGVTLPAPAAAALPTSSGAAGVGGGGGFLSGLGNAAKGVGHFIEKNPTAAAMGLQGLGQLSQAGSENAIRRAQAEALNEQNALNKYQFNRLQAQNVALDPIRQALLGQLPGIGSNVGRFTPAQNPYSHTTNNPANSLLGILGIGGGLP